MYFVIIIIFLVFLLVLKIGLNIKIKDVKRLKQLSQDNTLNKITNVFPKNKEICEEILKELNNKDVEIEELGEDSKSQTSLYLVMQNKIIIANIKDNFARIQTIAHECIHSIQNKQILKFNFIFSNISNLYFLVICILAILNLFNEQVWYCLLISLILIQSISFIVRSHLETDAMTRAEYVTGDYINEKNLLNKDDEEKIINTYKEINNIGIKLYNYILISKKVLGVIVLCILLIL